MPLTQSMIKAVHHRIASKETVSLDADSMMDSFNQTKSCIKGYRLFFPERDPRQFYKTTQTNATDTTAVGGAPQKTYRRHPRPLIRAPLPCGKRGVQMQKYYGTRTTTFGLFFAFFSSKKLALRAQVRPPGDRGRPVRSGYFFDPKKTPVWSGAVWHPP
jgi:hypothetical protein